MPTFLRVVPLPDDFPKFGEVILFDKPCSVAPPVHKHVLWERNVIQLADAAWGLPQDERI
jgi:hypothetical protein